MIIIRTFYLIALSFFLTTICKAQVGINTTQPGAMLEVNGYTKLGSDAPKLKIKKLTGTTAAAVNGNVSIAHGLTASKILNIQITVTSQFASYISPNLEAFSGGFEYSYYHDATNVNIINGATASGILARPMTMLITYEE